MIVTPSMIVSQLQECLPKYTDIFYDSVTVTAASVASNVLTLTIPGHSLQVGNQILINTALIRNKITAVSLTGDDTLRFTTEDVHDLTAFMSERPGNQWPPGASVTIENLQIYDLDTTAAGVPSNTMFETIPGYSLPTLSEDEYLLENRSLGAKGFQEIVSVTTDTITVNLTGVPDIPDGDVIITEILTSIRVSMAPDFERAKKAYTKQSSGKAWLFVIMTDREPSKSRNNTDDAISLPESGIAELNILAGFSTVVFLPTDDQLTGTVSQSLAYSDIFTTLLTCLYTWNGVGYSGDGIAEYNTAYYAHTYDWWVRQRIDYTDGYENDSTVAFRFLDFKQIIFDEGESNASIDL